MINQDNLISSTQKIIQFSSQTNSQQQQKQKKNYQKTFNYYWKRLIAYYQKSSSELGQSNIQISTNNAEDESFKKTNQITQRQQQNLKQVEYQIWNYYDQSLYQQLNYQKNYFIFPAGVVIDLEWNNRQVEKQCYKSMHLACYINTFKEGFISIQVTDSKTSKEYDLAIELLEKMQNQDFYYLSQLMKLYKIPTILLENQIEMIKSMYQEQDLLEIIKKREQFLQSKALELSLQYLNGDEFAQILTFQIKWDVGSLHLSSYYFSQAILALLGTANQDFTSHFMRNSKFQFFTGQSIRIITELNIKCMLNQIKNDWVEIPDFEIMAIDGIVVRCNFQIKVQRIFYPQNLQFDDTNNSSINNIESIVLMKYNLSQETLHNLIQLRQQIIQENSSHQCENDEVEQQQNQIIVQNFEYYIHSELFLKKFYVEKYQNLTNQNNKSKQICSFKNIS